MELYGFKCLNDGIELVYSLDNKLLSYCMKFIRPNYPFSIFIKFSSDFSEIIEYYPYYIKDFKTSINLFTGKENYNVEKFGVFIKYCHNFISYDAVNKPTQIYNCPSNEKVIYRYDNGLLNRKYICIKNKDIRKDAIILNLSNELKNSIFEKNPSYIILYLNMDMTPLRLIMGFDKNHILYRKILQENKVPFLKS